MMHMASVHQPETQLGAEKKLYGGGGNCITKEDGLFGQVSGRFMLRLK